MILSTQQLDSLKLDQLLNEINIFATNVAALSHHNPNQLSLTSHAPTERDVMTKTMQLRQTLADIATNPSTEDVENFIRTCEKWARDTNETKKQLPYGPDEPILRGINESQQVTEDAIRDTRDNYNEITQAMNAKNMVKSAAKKPK